MLKSLILPDRAVFFPQAHGPCYHYAPTTAALLYEVTVIRHRGSHSPGHSVALSNMRTCFELSGTCRLVALAHSSAGGAVNAGMYMATESGQYEWWRMSELPWPGISQTAALVHVRSLSCPLAAYVGSRPSDTRIGNMSLHSFLAFLHEWVQFHPYYFPALRQAELAARGFNQVTQEPKNWGLSIKSLPSFACHAFFTEVGNVRRPSPDLFDPDGNAKPSKTRLEPISVVSRGSRLEQKRLLPRAALVWELFMHESPFFWAGYRVDGNVTNDRIENIQARNIKTRHPQQFKLSLDTADAVFPYVDHLPSGLYLTRPWRYGIERLAFDIDATL